MMCFGFLGFGGFQTAKAEVGRRKMQRGGTERAGRSFLAEYGIVPQRTAPLLSLFGRNFEEDADDPLGPRHGQAHKPTSPAARWTERWLIRTEGLEAAENPNALPGKAKVSPIKSIGRPGGLT